MLTATDQIRQRYQDLFDRLRGEVLRELLRRPELSDGERQAIQRIALLPHPIEADVSQIKQVCKECSSGVLECVFQISEIGDRARSLIRLIEDSDLENEEISSLSEQIRHIPPERESYDLDTIGNMLRLNSMMLSQVAARVDRTLKGRCPECNGDVIEVIVESKGKKELRLRCRQQTSDACRSYDWYIQDVQRKNS